MAPPASQIELLGFDHVDLKVKNREKVRRFFVEQLGMDTLGEGPHHTYLVFGDQVLGLHDADPGAPTGGLDHLALRVGDWTGLRNRVRRARITVTAEKERDDSRSLYLRGPDGISIELVWRPDPHQHNCTSADHTAAAPEPEPDDAPVHVPARTVRAQRRRPGRRK